MNTTGVIITGSARPGYRDIIPTDKTPSNNNRTESQETNSHRTKSRGSKFQGTKPGGQNSSKNSRRQNPIASIREDNSYIMFLPYIRCRRTYRSLASSVSVLFLFLLPELHDGCHPYSPPAIGSRATNSAAKQEAKNMMPIEWRLIL